MARSSRGLRSDPLRDRRCGRDDHAEPPGRGERAEQRAPRRARRARSTSPTPTTTCGSWCWPARASTSRPDTTSRRSSKARRSGRAMRDTPEGKLHHEQVMYWDKCVRLRDFRKPTIAAVQGVCAAAGLMLACMCDLIVAADDARFSNPVAAHDRRRRRAARSSRGSSGPARPRSSCSAPRRSTRPTPSGSGS